MLKIASLIAAGFLLLLVGCSLRGANSATTASAKTPTPKPIENASQAPTAPEPPFSIAQTQVKLPRPQPISAEALASIPEAPAIQPQPAEQPASRAGNRQSSLPVAGPVPPPAVPPPQPEVVQETPRARLRPLEPGGERQRLAGEVQARQRKVADLLAQVKDRELAPEEKKAVTRIESFLSLSSQASKRGDFRRADALCNRALLLSQDLLRAK